MRSKDIKLLLGRSGNRCAICKIELTTDGAMDTIGEIAHIVSRSPDGPRGNESLQSENRDDYTNLILLCPNHHSEIDKQPELWPTAKLHCIKHEHEAWVSSQLEQGIFRYASIDNSDFIERTEAAWNNFAGSHVWAIAALTPLSINDDSIDPLDENVIATLNGIDLPNDNFWVSELNRYHTTPDENGISNLKLENLNAGDGHKVSIFRNGHCEFLFCLEGSVRQITEATPKSDLEANGVFRVFRYTHLAEVIRKQIYALKTIWINCLRFKNMTFTIQILNTNQTMLFSSIRDRRGGIYGIPVQSNSLRFSLVLDTNFDPDYLIERSLKRYVNYFGLVLDDVFNENGEYIRPRKL